MATSMAVNDSAQRAAMERTVMILRAELQREDGILCPLFLFYRRAQGRGKGREANKRQCIVGRCHLWTVWAFSWAFRPAKIYVSLI